MAIRNVVTEGDEILRKRCREVTEVNDKIRQTLTDMLETMRDAYGVGIAGPQVGLMRRMFVAEPDPEAEIKKVYYMVNPVILEVSDNLVEGTEGCLSVPGMIGEVMRPDYVKMEALDFDGNKQVYEFHDFEARVMLHEFDHLEGILYTDKAQNVRDASEEEE